MATVSIPKHNILKQNGRREGKAPHILELDTKLEYSTSSSDRFTPWKEFPIPTG